MFNKIFGNDKPKEQPKQQAQQQVQYQQRPAQYQQQYQPQQPQYMQQQNQGMYQQQPMMQQQQMDPMMQQTKIWADHQLGQVKQFYPDMVLDKQTVDFNQYRISMLLNVSQTPLYLRIDCPKNFPTQRPNIVVLARVVHKDLHDRTNTIINPQLDNWDLYKNSSNLLSVLRDIQTRFNTNPPIPAKILQQMEEKKRQQEAGQQQPDLNLERRQYSMAVDGNQEPQNQHPQDPRQVDMNVVKQDVLEEDDPKKSELIKAKLSDISLELSSITASVKGQLQVLPLIELNYMKENYDYMQDYALTQNSVLQIENLEELAQDTVKGIAEENVEISEKMVEMQGNNEDLTYEYNEKKEELQKLLDQYNKQKQSFQKSSMIKVVMDHTKSVNKEGKEVQKQMAKNEIDIDIYTKEFSQHRMVYYKALYSMDVLKQ